MATTTKPTPKSTAKPLPYHHGNLKDALLQGAMDVMAHKGVSEFSLSEIARNVGVTPAAAYKHFADKEGLRDELAQHGFALLRAQFEAAAPHAARPKDAAQAVRRFERIGHAYVQFGLQEPALFQLIFGQGASSFRQKQTTGGARTPTFAYFALALEDLHRFGVITQAPNPQDQWFAWSAIHGATELLIAGASGLVKADQAAKVITSRVMKALG
jgi:AcrR family transcriptional regulator